MSKTRKPKDIPVVHITTDKPMNSNERANMITEAQSRLFKYDFDVSTYQHNFACNKEVSRRKKVRSHDCDATLRKHCIKDRLKAKLNIDK